MCTDSDRATAEAAALKFLSVLIEGELVKGYQIAVK
jgi:hypothetical protein